MNNIKHFNFIDADRVSYRTLSLGSLDRISCRDQISSLQNRCGNIRGSITVCIADESALLADEQRLSYPISLFSMPTSGTSLRSMPWINSIDLNSIPQSYATQSVEELSIRYSANQPIDLSALAIAEFPSSPKMFQVFDVNIGIVLNSQLNNFRCYLPTSCIDKVALIPLELSQCFDCFTASFISLALEFASPIADFMLHDCNISTKVELFYNPSIRVNDRYCCQSRRADINTQVVWSDFRSMKFFLHNSLNDIFTISFEQEHTIEDVAFSFNLSESFEGIVSLDWQKYPFSAKGSDCYDWVVSWGGSISEKFVCEPDRNTFNNFGYLTPIPCSNSCRDCIIGRELVFGSNVFISSMMQGSLGDAYV